LRVCLLASGSKGNAIYIEASGVRLLIDVGLSAREISSRLDQIGVAGESLDAILVTHEHGDHCRGLGPMARRCHLPVHLHHKTLAALPKLGKVESLYEFEAGSPFQVKTLEIEPIPVTHDAAFTVGFLVRSTEGSVGVVTDLGISTRLIKDRLKQCRALVLEANHDEDLLRDGPYPWHLKQRIRGQHGHLSNVAGAELLHALHWEGLEAVFLAHLSETNNTPQHARAAAESVLQAQNLCQPQLIIGLQTHVSSCYEG
jgi:phosphoribosyl 1,2-cyclic phosphodiesterase